MLKFDLGFGRRLSRLLSVLHQAGGIDRDGASYSYDNVGNRTAKTFLRQGDPDPVPVTASYSYDDIYQLTQTVLDASLTETYSYDPVGNRLASLGVPAYAYNNSNELTAKSDATYTYDANGNTLTKTASNGTTTYTWDFENRLTSVALPNGKVQSYKYDPFGRRIQKITHNKTRAFAYDGDNMIEELKETGGWAARYTQGLGIDEPLALHLTAGTHYYEAVGLGSITSLTNAAGSVVNSYEYDSFGRLTSSDEAVTNVFRCTAREADLETGLYYYRARYYDSSTGRFLSEDPHWIRAGIDYHRYV